MSEAASIRPLQKHDMAVRMIWNKVPVEAVSQVLDMPELSEMRMQARFRLYSQIQKTKVPDHCVDNSF